MKKYGVLVLALLASTAMMQAQSLEEILEAHHEVMGLETLKETETIITRGKAMQMGMEFPVTIYQKRGEDGKMKMRTQIEFQGMMMIPSCYNGETGWRKMPSMGGAMELQDLSEEELEQAALSRMEGTFYNWEERGLQVTLLEEEEFEGTPCYVIKVVQPNDSETMVYMDQESYVILGQETSMAMNGQTNKATQIMGSYDMVEGMAMPMTMETRMQGQTVVTIKIEEVEVNKAISDDLFERPAQ